MKVDDVLAWLERAASIMVACVGERITDEYVYVEAAQKSPKDSLVVWVERNRETFAGGVEAVYRHAAGFSRARLVGNGGAIVKTRWLEVPWMHKVFSNTGVNVSVPPLQSIDGSADCHLVVDFGHGLLDNTAIVMLLSCKRFLALTVQANALNYGFHTLRRWRSADYVVIDHAELRLATGDQSGELEALAQQERERLGARCLAVTLGHLGCIVVDADGVISVPVVKGPVVDRMGAGDAFLGATAALACVGAPKEVLGLVGNIAGSLHSGVIGNSSSVSREQVEAKLREILDA